MVYGGGGMVAIAEEGFELVLLMHVIITRETQGLKGIRVHQILSLCFG